MSGSKSGSFTLNPLMILGGGVVLAISTAVEAVQAAREKVRAQRAKEQQELRRELDRRFEEWKNSEALSEKPLAPDPLTIFQDDLATISRPSSLSTSCSFQEKLKAYISEEDSALVPPPKEGTSHTLHLKQTALVNNINELLNSVTLTTSDDVLSRMKRLVAENDIDRAVAQAMEIRILVNLELAAIAQEQQEARSMLDGSPPDFPDALRVLLQDVADGRGRMDEKIRELIREGQRATEENRKKKAAEILQKALSKMGYQVESISESLFVDGGSVHLRNDTWDDGYCVRLTVEDHRIHFNMQRDIECGTAQDELAELKWKSEFDQVRDGLNHAGIRITDLMVHSEPGVFPVSLVDDIPIETAATEEGRKKRKKSQVKANYATKGDVK